MTDPILSIENLQTTFHTDKETIRAVDGVSFSVGPKETLGIVGESGSGKSVTARSILGLVDGPGRVHPDSSIRYHDPAFVQRIARRHPDAVRYLEDDRDDGDAYVFLEDASKTGQDLEVASGWVDLVRAPESVIEAARGSEIAMVFQDALSSLNPVFTVGNQLKELLRIHRGVTGGEATTVAAELLESVGIPDPRRRLKEFPHQFSGGMRQRAVIAMALACDPTVLLCDEPTTALDVTIQAQIIELLERLQRERDLSIVFITHDMGVIAQIADSVAVMYAGEIVERAPVDVLFESPAHPYTSGLLESIPGLAHGRDRLPTIEGSVPTPNEPPVQCRYAPRCPKAFEQCRRVHPQSVPVDVSPEQGLDSHFGDAEGVSGGSDHDDHRVSCLLYPESLPEADRLELHRARSDDRAVSAIETATGGESDE